MNAHEKPELKSSMSFRALVWEHCGFPVSHSDTGQRVVKETKTMCNIVELNCDKVHYAQFAVVQELHTTSYQPDNQTELPFCFI